MEKKNSRLVNYGQFQEKVEKTSVTTRVSEGASFGVPKNLVTSYNQYEKKKKPKRNNLAIKSMDRLEVQNSILERASDEEFDPDHMTE